MCREGALDGAPGWAHVYVAGASASPVPLRRQLMPLLYAEKPVSAAAGLAGALTADRGVRISGRGVGTGRMLVRPGCSHFYWAGWTSASVLKRKRCEGCEGVRV